MMLNIVSHRKGNQLVYSRDFRIECIRLDILQTMDTQRKTKTNTISCMNLIISLAFIYNVKACSLITRDHRCIK